MADSMLHRVGVRTDESGELREVIAEAIQKAESTDEAIEALIGEMRARPHLVAANINEILHYWARAQCDVFRRAQRTNVERRVAGSTERHRSAMGAAINAEYRRLMDMPLYGGKPISKATAAEIRESAGRYASQAGDMARKARWQIKVADAVTLASNRPDATPAKVLSETTLSKLWNEAAVSDPATIPAPRPKAERKTPDPDFRPRDRRQWITGRRGA